MIMIFPDINQSAFVGWTKPQTWLKMWTPDSCVTILWPHEEFHSVYRNWKNSLLDMNLISKLVLI